MTTMPQPASPASSYTATYDAWNRLVKIADGANTVSEYQYDGAKRRVVQKSYVSGTLNETRHLYYTEPSKWQVVEERVGTSTSANRQFVWGLRYIDDLILRDRDTDGNGTLDERLYSLQDANWNMTGLVNTSGVIQQRFVYTAYGLPVFLSSSFTSGSNTAAWEVLYAGYRFETAISLMHVRHRVLNPALGCWVQRDYLKYIDGGNLYQYCRHSPITLLDSTGRFALPPVVITGCIAGGTIPFLQGLFTSGPFRAICHGFAGCAGGAIALSLIPWIASNPALAKDAALIAGCLGGAVTAFLSSLCNMQCPNVCSLVMSGIGALAGCVFGALGSDPNDWPGDWPGADEVKELLTLAVVSAIANALGLAC
jgi:RHS repeat-associated protein